MGDSVLAAGQQAPRSGAGGHRLERAV